MHPGPRIIPRRSRPSAQSLLLLGVASCLVTACVTTRGPKPLSVNIQSMIDAMQPIDLAALAQQQHRYVHAQFALDTEPNRVVRTQRVLQQLAPAFGDSQFHVKVLSASTLNAFAVNDGTLYVTSGLVDHVNDDELAAALAHEMAHVHLRHPEQRVVTQRGSVAALAVFEVAQSVRTSGETLRNALSRTLLDQASGGLFMVYQRSQEFEADARALDLLRQSSIPAGSLLSLLNRLESLLDEKDAAAPATWARSHPTATDRRERVQSYLSHQAEPRGAHDARLRSL
jgi:Zn-dependent protease with chaperone function